MTSTVDETATSPEDAPDEAAPVTEPDSAPVEDNPDEAPPEQAPEPGTGDGEDDGEATPAGPVPGEVPEGMTPEAMEKEFKRVDRAAQRWNDTVVEFIQTTEQPIIRCECCLPGMPGFMFSPAVQAPSEQSVRFARAVAGMPEQPPLVQAADARTCPACDGWGDVLTGSKRNDRLKMKCQTCNGMGFVSDRPYQPTNGDNPHVPDVRVETFELETAPEDTSGKDPWGRSPEHPGYMIFPHPGMEPGLAPPGWQG